MERELIYPAVYKHFNNKYSAVMGPVIPVEELLMHEMLDKPNVTWFQAKHTETEYIITVVRNKKQFYINNIYSKEPLVLYKSLYDGSIPSLTPLEIFLGKTDKEKYPNVLQEYRFELIKY